MRAVANLFDAVRAVEPGDIAGYDGAFARIGPLIGASALGLTVYELPPGNSIAPYHYEYPGEEWLLIVEGSALLRTPEGETELVEGEVVCFPPGPAGAHKVTNRSEQTVLAAMLSTKQAPYLCVYPDSNKVGAWSGDGDVALIVEQASAVDYYLGEA